MYTASEKEGVIKDPCEGDSGGPLIIDNGGQPLLIGVLQVRLTGYFCSENFKSTQGNGYDCATNLTNGDGSWSNVVSQREWVLGHITGSIAGELGIIFIKHNAWMVGKQGFCHRTDQLGGKARTQPWCKSDQRKCLP